MIRRFFSWWGEQLRVSMPFIVTRDTGPWLDIRIEADRVHASYSDQPNITVLDVARDQVAEIEQALAQLTSTTDLHSARCRIWLRKQEALLRELELPLAAEENLREVLSFEMARRTPFRAEDVYFDAQVLQRNTAERTLNLQLSLIPQRALAFVTKALENWSLQPISAAEATSLARSQEQVVFAFNSGLFTHRSHTALNVMLGIVTLLLLGACVWLPINAQQHERVELAVQLQRAQGEATKAMAVRDELDQERAATLILSEARAQHPPMVRVLEVISRVLPDHTFLSRLQITIDEVNIHGTSQGASELIGILEREPMLSDVRFASPVTRDAASGGERFHVVARMRVVPSDDTQPVRSPPRAAPRRKSAALDAFAKERG